MKTCLPRKDTRPAEESKQNSTVEGMYVLIVPMNIIAAGVFIVLQHATEKSGKTESGKVGYHRFQEATHTRANE